MYDHDDERIIFILKRLVKTLDMIAILACSNQLFLLEMKILFKSIIFFLKSSYENQNQNLTAIKKNG